MSEQTHPQGEALNLQDLLADLDANNLSDYLTISISSDGQNTKISVATVADNPDVYTSILHGIATTDLGTLLGNGMAATDDSG